MSQGKNKCQTLREEFKKEMCLINHELTMSRPNETKALTINRTLLEFDNTLSQLNKSQKEKEELEQKYKHEKNNFEKALLTSNKF